MGTNQHSSLGLMVVLSYLVTSWCSNARRFSIVSGSISTPYVDFWEPPYCRQERMGMKAYHDKIDDASFIAVDQTCDFPPNSEAYERVDLSISEPVSSGKGLEKRKNRSNPHNDIFKLDFLDSLKIMLRPVWAGWWCVARGVLPTPVPTH